MLDELKNSLKEIQSADGFQKWFEKHSKAYLASAFYSGSWQLDFYCPSDDKMTGFKLEDDELKTEESEVFRKEKSIIKELKVDEIKIDFQKVDEIIDQLIGEKYKGEEILKKIIILQQKEFPFWNITCITKKLNILHLKINAISGEIFEEKIESALNFNKG